VGGAWKKSPLPIYKRERKKSPDLDAAEKKTIYKVNRGRGRLHEAFYGKGGEYTRS